MKDNNKAEKGAAVLCGVFVVLDFLSMILMVWGVKYSKEIFGTFFILTLFSIMLVFAAQHGNDNEKH